MLDLETARTAILHTVEELRRIDNRLARIGEALPHLQHGQVFNTLGEMRGAIDCVRLELLHDAIATLTTAATASERDLKRRFLSRALSRLSEGGRPC